MRGRAGLRGPAPAWGAWADMGASMGGACMGRAFMGRACMGNMHVQARHSTVCDAADVTANVSVEGQRNVLERSGSFACATW